MMPDAVESMVIIPAYRRDFPALVQSIDEAGVMNAFTRIDDFQQRDDVRDLRITITPVSILMRPGMIEAGDHRSLPIWHRRLQPFVKKGEINVRRQSIHICCAV